MNRKLRKQLKNKEETTHAIQNTGFGKNNDEVPGAGRLVL